MANARTRSEFKLQFATTVSEAMRLFTWFSRDIIGIKKLVIWNLIVEVYFSCLVNKLGFPLRFAGRNAN